MESIIKMIKIKSGDGGSETIAAEQIGVDTFRLLENPILSCRINYGTTVKVIKDPQGQLIMSEIIQASDFHTRQFMLSSSLNETEFRTKIGHPIVDSGGMWEVAFGGIAFIHILKNSTLDIDKLFELYNFYPTEIIDDINSGA